MLRVVAVIVALALGLAGGWFGRGLYDDRETSPDLAAIEEAAAGAVDGEVSSVSCSRLVRPDGAYDCVVTDPKTESIGFSETVRVVTDNEGIVSAKNLGFQP